MLANYASENQRQIVKTLRGNQLKPSAQANALAAFIYRCTVENNGRNAAAVRATGSKLPLITDEQWLAITEFEVTKSGDLDKRADHCWTHHQEIPEHKEIIDAWAAKQAATRSQLQTA